MSSASTWSSSRENAFGIFTHLFFLLAAAASTFNPSTATDVLVTSSISVLIVIYVGIPSIPTISTILFMTNVPWLQLSSRACVLITLLEFSWTKLTGTTLIFITWEPIFTDAHVKSIISWYILIFWRFFKILLFWLFLRVTFSQNQSMQCCRMLAITHLTNFSVGAIFCIMHSWDFLETPKTFLFKYYFTSFFKT